MNQTKIDKLQSLKMTIILLAAEDGIYLPDTLAQVEKALNKEKYGTGK